MTSTLFGQKRIGAKEQGSTDIVGAAQIPTINYSTGNAQALYDFSRTMFGLSAQLDSRLDEIAKVEGEREGALDALSGQYEERDFSTIRGRAYNDMGLKTMLTTMQTNSAIQLEILKNQYRNDPAGLKQALADYGAGQYDAVAALDPRFAAGVQQNWELRAMPAVAQAKENHFQMTRQEADAALILAEASTKAELKDHAAGLFSDNPEVAQASMAAVAALQGEIDQIYNAVDPATGKPLFSATERAEYKVQFRDEIMEAATMSWFNGQENKADALAKFMTGELTFKTEAGGGRNPDAANRKRARGDRNNNPLNIEFGDFTKKRGAVGSDGRFARFNTASEGIKTAGDLLISYGNRGFNTINKIINRWAPASDNNDVNAYAAMVSRATGLNPNQPLDLKNPQIRAGIVAAMIQHENGYQPYSKEYIQSSINGRVAPASDSQSQQFSVFDGMSERTQASVIKAMQDNLTHENKLAEAEEKAAEKKLKADQNRNEFDLTLAIIAPGQVKDPTTGQPMAPPTLTQIQDWERDARITPAQAKTLAKLLTTDAPDSSDRTVYNEALRQIYDGENAKTYIMENAANLSKADMASLLSKNQTQVVSVAEKRVSDDASFYQARLKDTLEPDGLLKELDAGAEDRKYMALEEYRLRVEEGESPREVAADIRERAKVDEANAYGGELGTMIKPRFSVTSQTVSGQIDIAASAAALKKAYSEGRLTKEAFARQAALIKRWSDIQQRVTP